MLWAVHGIKVLEVYMKAKSKEQVGLSWNSLLDTSRKVEAVYCTKPVLLYYLSYVEV